MIYYCNYPSFFNTSTSISSPRLIEPDTISSPSFFVRGSDSPEITLSSTSELPRMITPSRGMISPFLTMITSPSNFGSLSLLSTSIRLRLGLPTLNVITKTDLIQDKLNEGLEWSSSDYNLENEISKEVDGETLPLVLDMFRTLNTNDFFDDLIPVSNATGDGMVDLESALSRIINLGEEVED